MMNKIVHHLISEPGNVNLLRDAAHDGRRNITPSGWKATVELEGFEQHGEAQTGGARFVPKQIAFMGHLMNWWSSSSDAQIRFIARRSAPSSESKQMRNFLRTNRC